MFFFNNENSFPNGYIGLQLITFFYGNKYVLGILNVSVAIFLIIQIIHQWRKATASLILYVLYSINILIRKLQTWPEGSHILMLRIYSNSCRSADMQVTLACMYVWWIDQHWCRDQISDQLSYIISIWQFTKYICYHYHVSKKKFFVVNY